MACPDILGLEFSGSGKEALKEIKRIQGVGNMLASVLGGSALLEIFAGNKILGSVHNISKKDWSIWAEAMRSVPNIVRKEIRLIAFDESQRASTIQEREFWRVVVDGCR